MKPITIELDALPATLTDCVTLYRKVDQVADDCRGAILKHIRDERLYKQSGHKAFETFVDAEFGLSLRRANQLIEAFTVTHNLDGKNFSQMPASESQARTLSKLPAEEQADAWEEVVAEAEESGEKITAKKVEKVVAKRIGRESPAPKQKTRVVPPTGDGTLESLFARLEEISNKPNSLIVTSELRGVVAAIKALIF